MPRPRVLVCHGDADPFVTAEGRAAPGTRGVGVDLRGHFFLCRSLIPKRTFGVPYFGVLVRRILLFKVLY